MTFEVSIKRDNTWLTFKSLLSYEFCLNEDSLIYGYICRGINFILVEK